VIYPYLVAGAYSVVAKNSDGYDARFGLVLTQTPAVCTQGYHVAQQRSPTDGSNKPMDTTAGCTEPASKGNARGAQNAPRVATTEGSPVATYDLDSSKLTWNDPSTTSDVVYTGGDQAVYGNDSWKSLLLKPAS
jgi:phospholipid/cholesterol/gamma-HCH transport system substrate-binding protein